MRNRGFFDEVREPRAWLRTALVRLAVSRLRRRAIWERIRPRPVEEIRDADAADAIDLRRALLSLSAAERAAIVMHHYYDMPYTECAQALGMRADSVGKLLTRARRSLARRLTADTT